MRKFIPLFLLFSVFVSAQKQYPTTAFRSPLDIPVLLAGTFGELRSNHFHSGIDIKTKQREGFSVFAIGDGYISRIKISHWGFGKALYIQHPNGYTSVYAHLQKFAPEIEAFIKKKQYKKQSYEIEVYLKGDELTLKKGDIIAYTGNTGGSSGPHLHFEIRDAATQKPINPLLFGIDVKDTKSPVIKGVYAYALTDSTHINQSNKTLKLNLTKQKNGTFLADGLTAKGLIGFGVDTYDHQDLSYNKNGVYKVGMNVNGSAYFNYDFETFSFGETKYINTLIDYETYGLGKGRIQRLFKIPANKLSIYNKTTNNGFVEIKDSLSYTIKLNVSDFKGNKSIITIPIEGKKQDILYQKEFPTATDSLIASRDNIYNVGSTTVYFPAHTFYEDFYINLSHTADSIVSIHQKTVPVHKKYTLTFDVSKYSSEEKKQLFIAYLNYKNIPIHQKTYKKDNTFATKTRNLGNFTLVKDSVPPTIVAKNFTDKKWLSNYKYLKLIITDDLSGIKKYTATINDKWILMEYEPKTNTLTYNFNDIDFTETQHNLKVIVTDNVGNSTTFTSTFFRKN